MHTRLAAVSFVLLAAACGSSGKSSSPPTSTTRVAGSSTTSSTAPAVTRPVTIYLVSGERLAAAGRMVPTAATPDAAVRALLAGPQGEVERKLGFSTAIPAGTTLNSVKVADNVATVDLSQQFASGGGSLSMQERVGQVVFTVTEFPNVGRVRFRLDGKPASTIGGEGLIVDNVGRDAFTNVTPFILVESPTPGESVRSPLQVQGTSNTFEATVNYTLTDSSGSKIAEGHTTATAGTGTWGTFSFEVPVASNYTGPARLAVYEISPKDGSRVHGSSIPIDIVP